MENDELYRRAAFGKQVEAFWDSQIGQYLQGVAREKYATALKELRTCDPTDAAKVMRAQGEAWAAEHFEIWLSDAITDGLKSIDLIDNGEEE